MIQKLKESKPVIGLVWLLVLLVAGYVIRTYLIGTNFIGNADDLLYIISDTCILDGRCTAYTVLASGGLLCDHVSTVCECATWCGSCGGDAEKWNCPNHAAGSDGS